MESLQVTAAVSRTAKGMLVTTVTNGFDAIEFVKDHHAVYVVLMDESMPGITGLDTLVRSKLNYYSPQYSRSIDYP